MTSRISDHHREVGRAGLWRARQLVDAAKAKAGANRHDGTAGDAGRISSDHDQEDQPR